MNPSNLIKVNDVGGIINNNVAAGKGEILSYFSQICGEIEHENCVKIRFSPKSNKYYALVQGWGLKKLIEFWAVFELFFGVPKMGK